MRPLKGVKPQRESANVHRHQRVETSILEELRSILRDDITDPVLDGVRLTAIVLAPDGKLARIHFVAPKGHTRLEIDKAFGRASGFLRARLAEGVELKRTPELRFIFEAELQGSEDPE